MTKTEMKKLTLTDLIKDKEKFQPKKDKKKDLRVDRLGLAITITQAEESMVLDAMDLANDPEFKGSSDEFFVYNIVTEPNLKDVDLQKAYACVEPTDIVHKIFEAGEIRSIAEEGMVLSGYRSGVTPVDELKN